jgi:N6-L-threonylcarbamoyladenine synthase
MLVLGIETSCDECSFALVSDGREIVSHVVATQIEYHKPYDGVVPEIASRKHIEMITPVFRQCMDIAADRGYGMNDIDGIGVSTHPGLSGSLVVGLNYAKGLSLSLGGSLRGSKSHPGSPVRTPARTGDSLSLSGPAGFRGTQHDHPGEFL